VLKLLLVVVILAVAIYAVIRLLQGRGAGEPPAPPPSRPVAPDDDPDFLRDLDRKRRQRDDSDS
jgi:hypothetical protein